MPTSARRHISIAAPGHKYVASTHTPSGNGGHHGNDRNWEERCHALEIENRELKITRNQQEQTLKDLQAAFAKLKRDLKIPSGSGLGGDAAGAADGGVSSDKLRSKLLAVTRQRDDALRQLEELKAKIARFRSYDRAPAASTAMSAAPTSARGGGGNANGPAYVGGATGRAGPVGEVNVLDLLDGNARPQSATASHHHHHHLQPSSSAKSIPLATHEAAIRDHEQRSRRDNQRLRDLMDERDALRRQVDVAKQTRASVAPSGLDRSQLDADRNAVLETEATQLRQRYADVSAQLETVTLERDRFAADLNSARNQLQQQQQQQPPHHVPSLGSSAVLPSRRRFDSATDQHQPPHFAASMPLGQTAGKYQHHDQHPPLPTTSMEHSQRIIQDHADAMHPDVRAAVAQQTAQVAVLARRFEDAQSHAVALQQECERLVGELGAIQNSLASEKRRIFALESEKATLTIKAARTEEVEHMLTLKNEELITCQQQLLEMAEKMATYVREAESTARLEHASRLHDANSRAEAAERDQRAKERELYAVKLELQDASRHRDAAREDLADVKSRLETAMQEKSDLQQRLVNSAASLPVQPGAVEQSIAKMMSDGASANDDAASSEETSAWELSMLRESAAAKARDLVCAEQSVAALETDIQQRTDALVACTKQRDELLGENLRLRQEVTGIKTSLETRERAVIDAATGTAASIGITVDAIQCEPRALVAVSGEEDAAAVGAAPSVFVSIDGVSAFEPAVSDVVHSANANDVDLQFHFGGLSIGGNATEALRKDSAQFQLHRSTGLTSRVIAAASIRMTRILASVLEGGGTAVLHIPLLDGGGEAVAEFALRVRVSHVALALAVVRPDLQQELAASPMTDEATKKETATYALATLSKGDAASRVNAWLFSFRGVAALRIAVQRCRGLAKGADGVEPSPYVFYTVDCAEGLAALIADTVVHTAGRRLTCEPDFDADPVEHPVRVGSTLLDYVKSASITFAVFDSRSNDTEANLGTTTLDLAPLAESPQSTVVTEAPLHPSGTISIAMSWVRC